MRIAVLGAGAMGSWFGGKLAQHGCSVQLLTTNKAHRHAINKNRLTLQERGTAYTVAIDADEPTNIRTPTDLILLFTKAYQSAEAIDSIAHALDKHTHVLSLQNGLGNFEIITRTVAPENIWIGVSMLPVDKIAPGVVDCKGHGHSFFGNAANKNDQPIADKIATAFEPTGINLLHDTNIHQRIWEKAAFNAGMNALCALSHGRPGTVGDSPGAKKLAQDIAEEVALVAASQHINIDLTAVFNMIELSCTQHGDHIPSMLQDVLAKKRTEVDALNGAVTQIASKANVPAPLNGTLTTLIKLAELSHQRYD